MTEESSNLYSSSDTSELPLSEQLISEQSIAGTILGSIIGAIPGFIIYLLLLVFFPFYGVLSYFIPGVFIGFFAGFMGRGLTKLHRLIAALITLSSLLILYFIFEFKTLVLGLSMINCVLAAMLANRRLNREQEDAVFEYKIGLKREKI
ncbi:MAG: hypothetical protein HWE27_02060 [Gammaproteobacteria bacterium]|nr:hypothetical protein [Gammaproteobacteria bacterium]